MKKFRLKKLFILGVMIGCIFGFVGKVNASSYTSTLYLGNGYYLQGSTRTYTSGINWITIDVSSFNKINGMDYTKLQVDYIEEASTYCTKIGTHTFTIKSKARYAKNWGTLSTGNRYYRFATKINNVTYGGVTSNNVVMQSI